MTTSVSSRPTARPARSDRLLRRALQLDAAVTGLNGVLYLTAAPLLDGVLGLPTGLLVGVGLVLACFAVAVWRTGAQPDISAALTVGVIAANVLWVVASVALAVTGWWTPSALGTAWIGVQATVVAAFAVLQTAGLHARSRA